MRNKASQQAEERLSRLKRRLLAVGKVTWITVAVIAVVLLGVRLAMPHMLKSYVNRTLSKIPGYVGHVGDIWVSLYRGAYQIEGLKLMKKDGAVPVPFVSAQEVEFSVEWRQLFRGALVAEVNIVKPSLNFVAGKSEKTKQTGIDKSWVKRVKELFPLTINSFRVYDGEIHYLDPYSDPKVDLNVKHLKVTAQNLTNSEKTSQSHSLVAKIFAEGEPMPGSRMVVRADVDPFALKPKFKTNFQVNDVQLTKLNDFFRAYAKVDAESGKFSLYGELAAADGNINGYFKPLLDKPRFLGKKDVEGKSLPKALWEAIVAGVTELIKNHPRDRIATRVPISGKIGGGNIDVLATIGNLLRNAFIQAIVPGYEGSVHVGQVEKRSPNEWENVPLGR